MHCSSLPQQEVFYLKDKSDFIYLLTIVDNKLICLYVRAKTIVILNSHKVNSAKIK